VQARAHPTSRLIVVSLALLAACSSGHDRINDTALATVPAAEPPASPAPPRAAPVVAPMDPPRTAREDSIIARARVVLAAANPEFREWPATAYAPVQSDSETASARFGPLVGDLDGDGVPDVVFDGYDSHGELVPVVLSNRGKARVVAVTEGPDVANPPAPRRKRWMLAPYTFRGKRGQGVAFIDYNEGGWPILPAALYFLVDGHFSRLVEGE
jgi:hypothetical protein